MRADPKTLRGSRFIGGLARDVSLFVTGGAIGTAARARGVQLTRPERFLAAELGPTWTTIVGNGNPLAPGRLLIDYAGKWSARFGTVGDLNRWRETKE